MSFDLSSYSSLGRRRAPSYTNLSSGSNRSSFCSDYGSSSTYGFSPGRSSLGSSSSFSASGLSGSTYSSRPSSACSKLPPTEGTFLSTSMMKRDSIINSLVRTSHDLSRHDFLPADAASLRPGSSHHSYRSRAKTSDLASLTSRMGSDFGSFSSFITTSGYGTTYRSTYRPVVIQRPTFDNYRPRPREERLRDVHRKSIRRDRPLVKFREKEEDVDPEKVRQMLDSWSPETIMENEEEDYDTRKRDSVRSNDSGIGSFRSSFGKRSHKKSAEFLSSDLRPAIDEKDSGTEDNGDLISDRPYRTRQKVDHISSVDEGVHMDADYESRSPRDIVSPLGFHDSIPNKNRPFSRNDIYNVSEKKEMIHPIILEKGPDKHSATSRRRDIRSKELEPSSTGKESCVRKRRNVGDNTSSADSSSNTVKVSSDAANINETQNSTFHIDNDTVNNKAHLVSVSTSEAKPRSDPNTILSTHATNKKSAYESTAAFQGECLASDTSGKQDLKALTETHNNKAKVQKLCDEVENTKELRSSSDLRSIGNVAATGSKERDSRKIAVPLSPSGTPKSTLKATENETALDSKRGDEIKGVLLNHDSKSQLQNSPLENKGAVLRTRRNDLAKTDILPQDKNKREADSEKILPFSKPEDQMKFTEPSFSIGKSKRDTSDKEHISSSNKSVSQTESLEPSVSQDKEKESVAEKEQPSSDSKVVNQEKSFEPSVLQNSSKGNTTEKEETGTSKTVSQTKPSGTLTWQEKIRRARAEKEQSLSLNKTGGQTNSLETSVLQNKSKGNESSEEQTSSTSKTAKSLEPLAAEAKCKKQTRDKEQASLANKTTSQIKSVESTISQEKNKGNATDKKGTPTVSKILSPAKSLETSVAQDKCKANAANKEKETPPVNKFLNQKSSLETSVSEDKSKINATIKEKETSFVTKFLTQKSSLETSVSEEKSKTNAVNKAKETIVNKLLTQKCPLETTVSEEKSKANATNKEKETFSVNKLINQKSSLGNSVPEEKSKANATNKEKETSSVNKLINQKSSLGNSVPEEKSKANITIKETETSVNKFINQKSSLGTSIPEEKSKANATNKEQETSSVNKLMNQKSSLGTSVPEEKSKANATNKETETSVNKLMNQKSSLGTSIPEEKGKANAVNKEKETSSVNKLLNQKSCLETSVAQDKSKANAINKEKETSAMNKIFNQTKSLESSVAQEKSKEATTNKEPPSFLNKTWNKTKTLEPSVLQDKSKKYATDKEQAPYVSKAVSKPTSIDTTASEDKSKSSENDAEQTSCGKTVSHTKSLEISVSQDKGKENSTNKGKEISPSDKISNQTKSLETSLSQEKSQAKSFGPPNSQDKSKKWPTGKEQVPSPGKTMSQSKSLETTVFQEKNKESAVDKEQTAVTVNQMKSLETMVFQEESKESAFGEKLTSLTGSQTKSSEASFSRDKGKTSDTRKEQTSDIKTVNKPKSSETALSRDKSSGGATEKEKTSFLSNNASKGDTTQKEQASTPVEGMKMKDQSGTTNEERILPTTTTVARRKSSESPALQSVKADSGQDTAHSAPKITDSVSEITSVVQKRGIAARYALSRSISEGGIPGTKNTEPVVSSENKATKCSDSQEKPSKTADLGILSNSQTSKESLELNFEAEEPVKDSEEKSIPPSSKEKCKFNGTGLKAVGTTQENVASSGPNILKLESNKKLPFDLKIELPSTSKDTGNLEKDSLRSTVDSPVNKFTKALPSMTKGDKPVAKVQKKTVTFTDDSEDPNIRSHEIPSTSTQENNLHVLGNSLAENSGNEGKMMETEGSSVSESGSKDTQKGTDYIWTRESCSPQKDIKIPETETASKKDSPKPESKMRVIDSDPKPFSNQKVLEKCSNKGEADEADSCITVTLPLRTAFRIQKSSSEDFTFDERKSSEQSLADRYKLQKSSSAGTKASMSAKPPLPVKAVALPALKPAPKTSPGTPSKSPGKISSGQLQKSATAGKLILGHDSSENSELHELKKSCTTQCDRLAKKPPLKARRLLGKPSGPDQEKLQAKDVDVATKHSLEVDKITNKSSADDQKPEVDRKVVMPKNTESLEGNIQRKRPENIIISGKEKDKFELKSEISLTAKKNEAEVVTVSNREVDGPTVSEVQETVVYTLVKQRSDTSLFSKTVVAEKIESANYEVTLRLAKNQIQLPEEKLSEASSKSNDVLIPKTRVARPYVPKNRLMVSKSDPDVPMRQLMTSSSAPNIAIEKMRAKIAKKSEESDRYPKETTEGHPEKPVSDAVKKDNAETGLKTTVSPELNKLEKPKDKALDASATNNSATENKSISLEISKLNKTDFGTKEKNQSFPSPVASSHDRGKPLETTQINFTVKVPATESFSEDKTETGKELIPTEEGGYNNNCGNLASIRPADQKDAKSVSLKDQISVGVKVEFQEQSVKTTVQNSVVHSIQSSVSESLALSPKTEISSNNVALPIKEKSDDGKTVEMIPNNLNVNQSTTEIAAVDLKTNTEDVKPKTKKVKKPKVEGDDKTVKKKKKKEKEEEEKTSPKENVESQNKTAEQNLPLATEKAGLSQDLPDLKSNLETSRDGTQSILQERKRGSGLTSAADERIRSEQNIGLSAPAPGLTSEAAAPTDAPSANVSNPTPPQSPAISDPEDACDHLWSENKRSESTESFRQSRNSSSARNATMRYKKYTAEDFHFLKVLGRGSYGKVMLAELKGSPQYFAIKCLKKDVVLEDNDVECTMIEKKVLAMGSSHPYLCTLFCTFQSQSHLFFVMEYLSGGDLMFHIQQSGRFEQERARFYAAEIVCALKYLHKRGIVYRDAKLDNICLDADGHVRLVDFGFCKLRIYRKECLPRNLCGTPDYMAPEIIKGHQYNQSVDWWSFGVLLYEMLIGQSPFNGTDEEELFWSVCNEEAYYPRFISKEAKQILCLLLEKNPEKRLGMPGCVAGDISQQPFFRLTNWEKVEKKEVDPPFKPKLKSETDVSNFDSDFTMEKAVLTPIDKQILDSMDQTQFDGFSYTNPRITD